jgi:hypothetical protein
MKNICHYILTLMCIDKIKCIDSCIYFNIHIHAITAHTTKFMYTFIRIFMYMYIQISGSSDGPGRRDGPPVSSGAMYIHIYICIYLCIYLYIYKYMYNIHTCIYINVYRFRIV